MYTWVRGYKAVCVLPFILHALAHFCMDMGEDRGVILIQFIKSSKASTSECRYNIYIPDRPCTRLALVLPIPSFYLYIHIVSMYIVGCVFQLNNVL